MVKIGTAVVRRPLAPRLAAALHPTLNAGIDVTTISAGSSRRLWWRCERGHEWQAPVYRRSAGSGCPYCSGALAAPETSLAAVSPELANEWHPTRNGARTAAQTMPGSDRPVWWLCAHGHEWQAAPQARVTRGSGCPYCAGRRTTPERSLLALHPALAAEWHPTRNAGLDPAAISPGAARRVWWRCEHGHEWQAAVKSRVGVATGCPRCARVGHRGITLTDARPDLLLEWYAPLNGGDPGEISAGSHRQCWWRCQFDPSHVWRTQVRYRVRHGSGCPYCAGKRATPLHNLAVMAPELALQWHPSRNGSLSPTDLLPNSNHRVWWRCWHGHEWASRPANRIRGSGCPHCDR